MPTTYGSVFTGIGGFDLGWERAGMECRWQVESDQQCGRVLERHWPAVERYGDVREIDAAKLVRPDWVCGGFPCQDLSVAGRRAGLAGERSGLFFEFIRVVRDLSPDGVCIENVPGLLSSANGRDMFIILSSLAKLGYGVAYRVLDAQWFGVPQRRRRVFIVGCLGSWRRAAEILFERESLPWDSPPRREAGQGVAAGITSGSAGRRGVNRPGRRREDDVNLALCLNAKNGKRYDGESETFVPEVAGTLKSCGGISGQPNGAEECDRLIAHTLRADGADASEDGTGRGTPLVYQCQGSNVGTMGTLRAGNGNETGGVPFAFQSHAMRVRRLMPIECERLQGFPDRWTELDAAGNQISDSARYRMLGNAVAVPVAEWIGKRINQVYGVTP